MISGVLLLSLLAVDPRYHTYEEMAAELQQMAQEYPALCQLETIGVSTAYQWPLLCLKISDHPDMAEDEPRVLYNGVHHACELIGNEICLYLARDLLTRYGADPNVTRAVDSNQIFIVPLVNPDGHSINMQDLDTMWRKTLHDFNGNGRWDPDSDGVDLNRNYDFLWDEGGDTTRSSRSYRGPEPFSESEGRAIRDLCRQEKFVFDICFHSDKDPTMGEGVYWPWRWGNYFCPDFPEVRTIADSVARRIVTDDGHRTYGAIYGRAEEGGLTRNWLYHELGTFSYTIEVSQRYQPPGYRVDSICERVSKGAYYLLDRGHYSILTGHVTDSLTGEPLAAEVKVLEATSTPDTIAPRLSDTQFGRFWRPLKADTYTIEVSRYGYYPKRIEQVVVERTRATVLDVQLVHDQAIAEYGFDRPPANVLFLVQTEPGRRWAVVTYQVAADGPVQLAIYDLHGRRIRDLVRRAQPAGVYSVDWDGRNDAGLRVAAGVYFVRLSGTDRPLSRKIAIR